MQVVGMCKGKTLRGDRPLATTNLNSFSASSTSVISDIWTIILVNKTTCHTFAFQPTCPSPNIQSTLRTLLAFLETVMAVSTQCSTHVIFRQELGADLLIWWLHCRWNGKYHMNLIRASTQAKYKCQEGGTYPTFFDHHLHSLTFQLSNFHPPWTLLKPKNVFSPALTLLVSSIPSLWV